jgi:ABC-type dipeptide/oligopeptide/nickel transport system permease subunit
MSRVIAGVFAASCLALLVVMGMFAPEHLAQPDLSMAYASPSELPPFGADNRGRPLLEYAQQGARVVALPAMLGGLVVLLFGTLGGLLACVGSGRVQAVVQGFGEVVGALPRLVVVLVVALLLPQDMRGLTPIALTWALLAAPGAMDEASSVAGRLGGARFVEALRAHGFSRARIYLYHIVALNLRPVVVRQAIETVMQVVFLEIALSYLALSDSQPSFTHNDSVRSWADILYLGYQVILDVETGHALALGLGLVGVVALMSLSVTWAVRAR